MRRSSPDSKSGSVRQMRYPGYRSCGRTRRDQTHAQLLGHRVGRQSEPSPHASAKLGILEQWQALGTGHARRTLLPLLWPRHQRLGRDAAAKRSSEIHIGVGTCGPRSLRLENPESRQPDGQVRSSTAEKPGAALIRPERFPAGPSSREARPEAQAQRSWRSGSRGVLTLRQGANAYPGCSAAQALLAGGPSASVA
jgi:hypothetical protein